jgi:glucitol operon activator protein
MWVLQMYLASRQARAFMAEVKRLRGLGRTAIGASSQSRFRRRTYVALAAKDGRVVDAVRIAGLTVWARPKPAPTLAGCTLDELVAGSESAVARAAAMAAETLRTSSDEEVDAVQVSTN